MSLLAYLEKEEVDCIAKGKITEGTKELWSSFKQYVGEYQLFHDKTTDVDVILLANNQEVWVQFFLLGSWTIPELLWFLF